MPAPGFDSYIRVSRRMGRKRPSYISPAVQREGYRPSGRVPRRVDRSSPAARFCLGASSKSTVINLYVSIEAIFVNAIGSRS